MVISFEAEKLSGMKVLMVDQSSSDLDILGYMLKKWGLNISLATSGESAFNKIRKNKPDLILLDVVLPGLDGFEVCKKLKLDNDTKGIPVVFISSIGKVEDVVKGFEVGGADYIKKPFQEKEVLARIGMQLSLLKMTCEKEGLIKDLDSLSRIDLLTKLSNRRDILERLEHERSRFERYNQDFSIILAEMDNLRMINDQFGLAAGDYAIKEVGGILTCTARKIDIVGRWSGGVYLCILTQTPLSGAMRAAEKIKTAIESHKLEFNKNNFQVTMSLGVSNFEGTEGKIDGLVKEAEALLSNDKKQ